MSVYKRRGNEEFINGYRNEKDKLKLEKDFDSLFESEDFSPFHIENDEEKEHVCKNISL